MFLLSGQEHFQYSFEGQKPKNPMHWINVLFNLTDEKS